MSSAKTNILCVEDSPVDQALIQREFRQWPNCDVWYVFTGEEAVKCLTDPRKKFHLVLLDLNLESMRQDGNWVLQEMETLRLKPPIAILSGLDGGALAEATKHASVITAIQKPLDQEKIKRLLDTLWV